jgi:hypothetical protein
MCDPVTLMTVAKIGSSVIQFQAEKEKADATNARNATARLQIAQARDDKTRQQILSETQQKEQQLQKKMDSNVQAMELTSRAAVSAGEAGVAGRVVDAIMTKYERDRLTTNTNINSDIQSLALQGTFDRSGIESEAQSQINQYQPVAGPSVLGLVADIGLSIGEGQYMKT